MSGSADALIRAAVSDGAVGFKQEANLVIKQALKEPETLPYKIREARARPGSSQAPPDVWCQLRLLRARRP